MQQSALLTEDVKGSNLTLVVALPPMRLLPGQALATNTSGTTRAAPLSKHLTAGSQAGMHSGADGAAGRGSRRLLLDHISGDQLAWKEDDAKQLIACGVSEPGLSTACGQVYMDDGDQLQVRLSPLAPNAMRFPTCACRQAWQTLLRCFSSRCRYLLQYSLCQSYCKC